MSYPQLIEKLEDRLFLAQTPVSPRPDTLGTAFDKTERADLLARLTMLPSSVYTSLQSSLAANNLLAFDTTLLNHMRDTSRPGSYFFAHDQASSIASYIQSNLSGSASSQISQANDVTDDRLFPAQSSVSSYTVSLPPNINWSDPSPSTNPEFLSALNRQEWWVSLAQSYRYTGDNKYLNELLYELADWSSENLMFSLPSQTSQYASYGFDVSLRVENWLMSYYSVLGTSGWTPAANSLLLYKLIQQGDVLNTVSASLTDFSNNRTIAIGRSLLYLGLLLPEVNSSGSWESRGRNTLYQSVSGQFYTDGSHREQSPGYAVLALDDLLEAYYLDHTKNGNPWNGTFVSTLYNGVEALWQQLSPDGNRPAIGDTYRISASTLFLKAAVILGESRWPEAKPRTRDVWVLGTTNVNPYLGNPVNPSLGNRDNTYRLSDSGNYVLRSGNDTQARQINFKAGPKGGIHGHYDLLGIEFFGYGRPLLADTGAYLYDPSDPKRAYAESTKAHNTIGVADLNHGPLENLNAIRSSDILPIAGGWMISAGHQGYFHLPGAPTVSRALWFDGNNTLVVVDFVESTTPRNWEQNFILQNQNTTRDLTNGLIYTKNTDGLGNVRIQSLLRPGQTAYAAINSNTFTTSNPPPDHVDPATRYYVQQLNTTYAVFATLITAHPGSASSAVSTASWVSVPTTFGQSAVLNINGTNITFSPPSWQRLNSQAQSRGAFNDIAYDSAGRLHHVFWDRDEKNLKYAVRDTNGVWSTVQIVDDDYFVGYNPDLEIDALGRPGIAYQDAWNGDLRYAYLSPITNTWEVHVVDVPGSTGGYPSLVFSRNNTPVIAYYNKSKGDLRLALQQASGWEIQTIDSQGDVGRFPSIQLDPNRPTASKFAIAYEDTTNMDIKWAIQYKTGWRYETVDNTMTISGGYVSLSWYDSGASTDRYRGVATYYDAGKGQLRYAYDTGGIEKTIWSSLVIASKKRQGLYSKLHIENNRPRVFFFDGTNNKGFFLSSNKIAGGTWSLVDLGPGGREIHFAYRQGRYLYTSLDESTGFLTVRSV
jgi:hypothetical protein